MSFRPQFKEEMNVYQIHSNGRTDKFQANSMWEAQALFQEKYGTWPPETAVTLL